MQLDMYLNVEEREDEVRRTAEKMVQHVMSDRLGTTTPETPLLRVGGVVVEMIGRGDIYRAILEKYFTNTEVTPK